MPNGPLPEQWHSSTVHTMADMKGVIDRLVDQMTAGGFAEKDLFSMRLAVEEAVVNAIKHGNAGDPAKSVQVNFQVSPSQVLVDVEDQGPGFDPDAVPDPLAPENLERPSGRGLFLIRYYMTWVRFNERGNRLTMCKEKTAAAT